MELYETEEQQVEALKKWVKAYGPSIGFGAVLGLSLFAGWRWYSDKILQEQRATSAQYESTIETLNKDDSETNVIQLAQQFQEEHKDSSYSVFAAFLAAKKAIERGNLVDAQKQLEFAISKAQDPSIKAIATIRLARVQIALSDLEKAAATLSQPLPDAFKGTVSELKGDIYVKQGKLEQAKTSYQAAIDNGEVTNTSFLQNKLDNLALAE